LKKNQQYDDWNSHIRKVKILSIQVFVKDISLNLRVGNQKEAGSFRVLSDGADARLQLVLPVGDPPTGVVWKAKL